MTLQTSDGEVKINCQSIDTIYTNQNDPTFPTVIVMKSGHQHSIGGSIDEFIQLLQRAIA